MEARYHHARTCVYNINYHIIWCVKYRRKVLRENISQRLYSILGDIATEKGFEIPDCKVGDMDHVHCFVTAKPLISITQIVKYLKGISGLRILTEFPDLRELLWKGQLWSPSYFVETIGSTSEANIRKYIERQQNFQQ